MCVADSLFTSDVLTVSCTVGHSFLITYYQSPCFFTAGLDEVRLCVCAYEKREADSSLLKHTDRGQKADRFMPASEMCVESNNCERCPYLASTSLTRMA